jgi:ketosteroid isomerase-like protein
MKTILFITMVLFSIPGYSSQLSVPLTPQDQDIAKKEIREVVKLINQNLEKMDVEALFQSYSDSSDFFTTDGSMINLQVFKNHNAAWFNSLATLKVTTFSEYYRFLPGNTVISSWIGKFEMTLKSGEQLKNNKFGITYIFRKIDNKWKVIHQHASALPPSQ